MRCLRTALRPKTLPLCGGIDRSAGEIDRAARQIRFCIYIPVNDRLDRNSVRNCARKIDRSVVARDRTAASAARPVAKPRPVAWKHLPTELLAFSGSRAMTTLIAILGNHPHGWNSTRDAELRREKLCAIASDSERFFLVVVGIFKNEADILPESSTICGKESSTFSSSTTTRQTTGKEPWLLSPSMSPCEVIQFLTSRSVTSHHG